MASLARNMSRLFGLLLPSSPSSGSAQQAPRGSAALLNAAPEVIGDVDIDRLDVANGGAGDNDSQGTAASVVAGFAGQKRRHGDRGNHSCVCGCPGSATGKRLSMVPLTRNAQLSALGFSRSKKCTLADSLWKRAAADGLCPSIVDTRLNSASRSCFIANEHFRVLCAKRKGSSVTQIPTHRFEGNCYVPVVSLATPKTPDVSPFKMQLEGLADHVLEDVRDLAKPVVRQFETLERRVADMMRELEEAKARLRELEAERPCPMWVRISRGLSPSLRFEMVSGSSETCRTLFGFTGDKKELQQQQQQQQQFRCVTLTSSRLLVEYYNHEQLELLTTFLLRFLYYTLMRRLHTQSGCSALVT
jgi:hypothetical protein